MRLKHFDRSKQLMIQVFLKLYQTCISFFKKTRKKIKNKYNCISQQTSITVWLMI